MRISATVQCCAEECLETAKWGLIPGFDNGRERYLCGRHMVAARERSPVEADCYAPLGRERDYRARLIKQPTS